MSDHFFVMNHKEPQIMKRIEHPGPPGPQTANEVLREQLQYVFRVDEIKTGCILVSTVGVNGKDAKHMTEFKELYKTYSRIKAFEE